MITINYTLIVSLSISYFDRILNANANIGIVRAGQAAYLEFCQGGGEIRIGKYFIHYGYKKQFYPSKTITCKNAQGVGIYSPSPVNTPLCVVVYLV